MRSSTSSGSPGGLMIVFGGRRVGGADRPGLRGRRGVGVAGCVGGRTMNVCEPCVRPAEPLGLVHAAEARHPAGTGRACLFEVNVNDAFVEVVAPMPAVIVVSGGVVSVGGDGRGAARAVLLIGNAPGDAAAVGLTVVVVGGVDERRGAVRGLTGRRHAVAATVGIVRRGVAGGEAAGVGVHVVKPVVGVGRRAAPAGAAQPLGAAAGAGPDGVVADADVFRGRRPESSASCQVGHSEAGSHGGSGGRRGCLRT